MVKQWFIVPPLAGPASGGTVYNRELLRELSALGVAIETLAPEAAAVALRAGQEGCFWVDSLFLEQFAALDRENLARRPLGLLSHYLPSLVEHGDALTGARLTAAEAFTLAHAGMLLAPSAYMRSTLIDLGLAAHDRCLVIEPGCLAGGPSPDVTSRGGVRAALIANVTPGKGVEPFLRALAAELAPADPLTLTIAGRLDADPDYARACVRLTETQPMLAGRVTFTGELSPHGVVEQLGRSNLLISASRMEYFGMALAEARTLGVPIVARGAGNAAALVAPAAGGQLLDSDEALARACCTLARDGRAHAQAIRLAHEHLRAPRSFVDAARDFVAQVSAMDLSGAR